MRLDGLYRTHHPGDGLPERNLGFGWLEAVTIRVAHLFSDLGALDQRFGRYAAGVETVAPHPVRLDQGHLRLDRRCDQRGHKAGRPGADHHQIAVEALRPGKAGIDLAAFDPADDRLGNPGGDTEQGEGGQNCGRSDACKAVDLRQLRARIHIDDRAQQHAYLAHPSVSASPDPRQPHDQVDDEERKQRDHADGEEIECPVAFEPLVHRLEPRPETLFDRIAQDIARSEEGQHGAQCRGEGDHDSADHDPEQRACRQRHHRCTGQGCRGHCDIGQEEQRDDLQRIALVIAADLACDLLDAVDGKIVA